MTEPLLRVHGAAFGYARTPVLRDVSFAVEAGSYWLLVGPNGSGKTTLLRGILGALPLRGGSVTFDGARASRERRAFVPQHSDWDPDLPTTVREFVRLGLVGTRTPAAARRTRIAPALAAVGLEGTERRDLRALSGGQRRRAALARALVREPNLLLLDEPTEGLDVGAQARLLALLGRLREERGLALVVVTHDLRLVRRDATHVAVFDEGRVVAGPVDEVDAVGRLRVLYGEAADAGVGGAP